MVALSFRCDDAVGGVDDSQLTRVRPDEEEGLPSPRVDPREGAHRGGFVQQLAQWRVAQRRRRRAQRRDCAAQQRRRRGRRGGIERPRIAWRCRGVERINAKLERRRCCRRGRSRAMPRTSFARRCSICSASLQQCSSPRESRGRVAAPLFDFAAANFPRNGGDCAMLEDW